MKAKALCVLAFVMSYDYSCPAAHPVGGWTRHNIPVTPGSQAYGLGSIAFGNGVFVAAGGLFRTYVSADGANWTNSTPALFQNVKAGETYWRSVRFLDGQFTVVGHTNIMLRSPDGVQWTLIPLPPEPAYLDVAYHDGHYVTGCIGTYISSTSPSNTLDWVRIDPKHSPNNQSVSLQGVVYGQGKFVANTLNMYAPNETVFHLDEGTNWIAKGGPGITDPVSPTALIYEEGRFMLAHWKSSLVYSSTNGVEWQVIVGLPGAGSGYHPNGVAYGEGHWVTVGSDSSTGFRLFSSTNATDWVMCFSDAGEPQFSPLGVAFGHGTFVVVGGGMTGLNTYQSGSVGPPPPLLSPRLEGPSRRANGAFRFGFTNVSSASFTTLASTNLATGDWTVVGSAIEISPGQYQFTDRAATNHPRKFYQIRSP